MIGRRGRRRVNDGNARRPRGKDEFGRDNEVVLGEVPAVKRCVGQGGAEGEGVGAGTDDAEGEGGLAEELCGVTGEWSGFRCRVEIEIPRALRALVMTAP